MAALTPAIDVITYAPSLISEFFPDETSVSMGTISIREIDGYLYTPPAEGQVWPRGDYTPLG